MHGSGSPEPFGPRRLVQTDDVWTWYVIRCTNEAIVSNTDVVPPQSAIQSDPVARFSGGKYPRWLTNHRSRWLRWGLALAIVAATTRIGLRAVSDPSPWMHMRVGQFLLDGGRFGLPDPWAPYPVRSFVPTEWLPSIVAQLLYSVAGLPAICLLLHI